MLLVVGAFMLGNAAYLWLRQPDVVLPTFYQTLLRRLRKMQELEVALARSRQVVKKRKGI